MEVKTFGLFRVRHLAFIAVSNSGLGHHDGNAVNVLCEEIF